MDIVQPTKYKILLIGDNGIDQYQYGTVTRISPEAPVPIINYTNSITKPGMAANVKDNLEKLNCIVDFMHGLKTCVKTRIIDSKSKQHLLRIDQDMVSRPVMIDRIDEKFDAIVISDYNKGTVTYELVEKLRKEFVGPIFVDTKKTDLIRFEGCLVKINQKEFEAAKTFPTDLIVTLGKDGVRYKEHKINTPPIEAFDVCGAGDSFLAALTYAYIHSGDVINALHFATRAASVTVQHSGVYSPTLDEIKNVY